MAGPLPALLLAVVAWGALPRPASAQPSPGVEEAARVLATHASERWRQQAALVLGQAVGAEDRTRARVALRTALADGSASVRRQVAASLAGLPEPANRAPLEQALGRERERPVVPALLLALGALGEADLVPALAAWRKDPAPEVRAAALTAVGDAGGARARIVLLEALGDPGGADAAWQVRAAALLGLARVGVAGDGEAAREALDATGGWASWLARSALARAAPQIESEPRPLLERLLLDPDERVAVTAALSVARVEGEAGLLALLSHPADTVRAAAAGAASQLRTLAAQPTLTAMAYRDRSARTRWSAALALFRLGVPEADEMVLAGLGSREPAVWAEAVAALEARTGTRHGTDASAWRRALQRQRAGARGSR